MNSHLKPTLGLRALSYRAGHIVGQWKISYSALEGKLAARQGLGSSARLWLLRLCLFSVLAVLSLFIGFAIITGIAVMVYLLVRDRINFSQSSNTPGPDYMGADLYLGDYDDNGHYIGDCKSSD